MMSGRARKALLGLWLAASAATAQAAEHGEQAFDCVVRPKSTVEIGSPEQGIIAQLSVGRGDLVEKGTEVARLDSELQALSLELAKLKAASDVEIRSHEARVEFRMIETQRAESLHEREVVSSKTLDEAAIERHLAELSLETARMEHAMAQVEQAQAQKLLDRRSVRSPVKGVVTEVAAEVGEYVHEQKHIMKIAEIDPLRVEAYLPVSQFGTVRVGTRAEVEMEPPISGVYPARVTVVDRVFDPESRTFGVSLSLPNADFALPAGVVCTVRFLAETSKADKAGPARIDSEVDLELGAE